MEKEEKSKVKSKATEHEKRVKKLQKSRVSPTNLIMFTKSLASMLKATIPLTEAIKIMEEQSDDKVLTEVLSVIHDDIETGEKLSGAMEKFPNIFPEIMISLIYAGESGGSLEMNLNYLADYLAKQHEVNKKIKSAIIYPLIIIGLTGVQMTAMIFFIFPKLEDLFKSFPNIPMLTQKIMEISGLIRENWYFVLAGIIIAYFVITQFFKTKKGKRLAHWLSINFPVLKGLFVSNILANFARTLTILMQSGINISTALKISIKTVGNTIYSEKLQQVYENAEKGQSISDSLKEHPKFFNKSFIKMVEVGERTGTLEDNLSYLHKFYTDRVDDITNNITVFIEPLLLILVGVIIGFLGISVIVPIYQLMSSINA
jgi:type IV pilus assembly protein PilC